MSTSRAALAAFAVFRDVGGRGGVRTPGPGGARRDARGEPPLRGGTVPGGARKVSRGAARGSGLPHHPVQRRERALPGRELRVRAGVVPRRRGERGSATRRGAWYNLGNTLYRQGALPESLEAFKQALRADPADIDAKHNLERVLEQMQQQQQQQQGDGENEQEDEQETEGQPPPEGENRTRRSSRSSRNRNQPEQNPDDAEPPPEGGPLPPGEMTREEAERLLGAIQEDQDEVNRKPRTAARGTRPRRDW